MIIALIGNGTFFECADILRKKEMIIAVDGGANHCKRMNISPDVIIGDGDSITDDTLAFFSHIERKKMDDQDFSDFQKGIEYCRTLTDLLSDITGIECYFFSSIERIDHSVAAYTMLARYPNLPLTLHTPQSRVSYLSSGEHYFTGRVGDIVSFFPFPQVGGVYSDGLEWNLSDAVIAQREYSLSNRVASSEYSVRIESGGLLFIQVTL